MLDDFVDVSKDEKQLMHLWNSFVRKQRQSVLNTSSFLFFSSCQLNSWLSFTVFPLISINLFPPIVVCQEVIRRFQYLRWHHLLKGLLIHLTGFWLMVMFPGHVRLSQNSMARSWCNHLLSFGNVLEVFLPISLQVHVV